MDNSLHYPDPGRRARRPARVDPALAEIIDALVHFRGQAHRDAVCHHIASNRAGEARRASEALKREVFNAFEAHMTRAEESKRARSLLDQPSGEGRYRWGRTRDAKRLLGERRQLALVC
jgi:hypothetical protein